MSKEFQAYCENIRRAVKSMAMDLKAKERLLQETIQQWRIYSTSYDSLVQWLQEGEYILRRSSEEKLVRSPSLSPLHSLFSSRIISRIWNIGDRSSRKFVQRSIDWCRCVTKRPSVFFTTSWSISIDAGKKSPNPFISSNRTNRSERNETSSMREEQNCSKHSIESKEKCINLFLLPRRHWKSRRTVST